MNIGIGTGGVNVGGMSGLPGMGKTRRKKFGLGSLLIVVIVGLVFSAAGFFINKQAKINPSWTRVSGQVVSAKQEINPSTSTTSGSAYVYTAQVRYTVNGTFYTVYDSSSSSFSPAIGSTKMVAYDPNNPSDAKVVQGATTSLISYVFMALGPIIIIIAGFAFIKSSKRTHNIDDLVHSGQKVQGIITDIQTINSGQSNYNQPGVSTAQISYKIVVTATDLSGAVQSYTSDSLSGIGGLAMADFKSQPIPIDVYLDPANPKNYYVDISEVPNLTPERIADLIRSAAGHQTVSHDFANSEQPNPVPAPAAPVASPVPAVQATPPVTPPTQNPSPPAGPSAS